MEEKKEGTYEVAFVKEKENKNKGRAVPGKRKVRVSVRCYKLRWESFPLQLQGMAGSPEKAKELGKRVALRPFWTVTRTVLVRVLRWGSKILMM